MIYLKRIIRLDVFTIIKLENKEIVLLLNKYNIHMCVYFTVSMYENVNI